MNDSHHYSARPDRSAYININGEIKSFGINESRPSSSVPIQRRLHFEKGAYSSDDGHIFQTQL